MDVQNYRADSIQEYRLMEKVLHGKFHDELKNYDLMTIIMLNLGKKYDSRFIKSFAFNFMDLKSSEEKEKILRDDIATAEAYMESEKIFLSRTFVMLWRVGD